MSEGVKKCTQRRRRQPRWNPSIRRMNRRRRTRYRVQIYEAKKRRNRNARN